MAKLIIYFSLSNNTKKAAQKVQEITGADIYRLEAKNPYPEGYSKYSKVGMKEFEDDIHPEIKEKIPNLEKYDTIYLNNMILLIRRLFLLQQLGVQVLVNPCLP
ncbi:flavodoxin [Companilactobacillus pabuli]|uniref:Flavodoxin-like domain-containing protein n=1 Tax=Companilactobacillus pabuli TaxID=2714036 RepID=A0A7L7KV32_9LACO|nr:flavodoxin [Companilactobacillus pabuli]QMT83146.1 hypothetical protein G6534_00085 [Companilactobacillus pabuli]